MNDEKIGYPMFKMDDIEDGFLVDDTVRYTMVNDQEANPYLLQTGDVLFNRVNSIEFVGRTGIYKLDQKSVFASYLIRLQINDSQTLLPDYLDVFLNSSYGRKQINRCARRAVNQANVNAEELKRIQIALLPMNHQKMIANFNESAWQGFMQAKLLYSQAEDLLLEELGLKNFESEIKRELWSIVNLSETKRVNRIDADYFQPKYQKLESVIKKYKNQSLEKILENVPAKFDVMKEPNKLFKYVELSNINASIGIIDGFSEMLGKEAPSRAKRVLKKDNVIVSSVEGSLGKVALVHKEHDGFLASTGFFQFRSEEILPEVLLILAKSIVFQWQLEKRCAGTILTAVPKESINDILVPILSQPIQQKIADLVRKSHEARKKSKELLEEAKHKVEELIETSAK